MLQFLSLTQSSIPDCTTEYSPVVFLKNKENPSKMRKKPIKNEEKSIKNEEKSTKNEEKSNKNEEKIYQKRFDLNSIF